MKFDLTQNVNAVDGLLKTPLPPAHRQILLNYRRHALLEVSGRYEEIFAPDMTVAEPMYHTTEKGCHQTFVGADAVKAMYQGFVETGGAVMCIQDEHLAVADWGFASEAVHKQHFQGRHLIEMGDEVAEPDSYYLLERRIVMIWHYRDGLLLGENVYEDATSRTITPADPADVLTQEEAREMLAPLLERGPDVL